MLGTPTPPTTLRDATVATAVAAGGGVADHVARRHLPGRLPARVSVIVPLRDAAGYVERQLRALQVQHCPCPVELLVVDNGSVDGGPERVRTLGAALGLRLTLLRTGRAAGINVARNHGVAHASGELLVFCDADDEVDPGWLAALVAAAPTAHLLGGALDEVRLNESLRWQRPPMPSGAAPTALGFLPFAPGANLAVWADVVAELGGFDERFRAGNCDVELSFRAQLAGYRLAHVPDAVVAYRHRPSAAGLFSQFRAYGRAEPLLWASYRDAGLRRDPPLRVARRWAGLALGPLQLRSAAAGGRWLATAGFSLGRVEGSIARRRLFL